MDNKLKATIIVLVLVGATVAGVVLLMGIPASEPADSTFNGKAWINEVHMNSTLTVDEEYFEIYISAAYTESTISGWKITTFDNEGRITLPTIMNVDAEDYIVVYTGSGIEDLDASDGTATIYLGRSERILDAAGDEIAIFDEAGNIIHFMRYSGGNGDALYDGWSETDEGPSLPVGHSGSLSY
ncbi:lamin tail domain-containing protein, partial [Candidatus Thorarchaeota archaeon]